MGQCGLDEFDGAARPDDSDGGLDDIDGDGAEDVEGQPGEDQPVITAGVPVELDDVNEKTKRGGDVLLVRIPRPADMAGGAEGRFAHALEVRHGVAPLVNRGQNVAIGLTGLPDVPAKRTGATARWKSHWPSSAAVVAHTSRSQLSSSHRPIATRLTA